MRVYTAHIRPNAPPLLVPEGFSWGALIFGPLWLAAHRAWLAGLLALCAAVLIGAVPGEDVQLALLLTLAWVLGLCGQDLRRWTLARRGYLLAHVVAAPDRDAALARLLARRPDLITPALA